jgi:hypothetical protein
MSERRTGEELPRYFRENAFAPLLDELDPVFTFNGRRVISDILVRTNGADTVMEFAITTAESDKTAVLDLWRENEALAISAASRFLEPVGWALSNPGKLVGTDQRQTSHCYAHWSFYRQSRARTHRPMRTIGKGQAGWESFQ